MPWHDNLFVVAGLFVVFIILIAAIASQGKPLWQPQQQSNQTSGAAGLEAFKATLENTEEIAIIQNLTGAPVNTSQFVVMCAAGLANSWGKMGKNLSKLHIYAIEEGSCLYSTPTMSNETGKLYVEKTIDDCVKEYTKMPYWYVAYGPSFSTFTNTTAITYVDEAFKGECAFGFPETGQAEIKQANVTEATNATGSTNSSPGNSS